MESYAPGKTYSEDDLTVQSKSVILANKALAWTLSEIEHFAVLAETGVHHFHGSHTEVGKACGKYCPSLTWVTDIRARQSRLGKGKQGRLSFMKLHQGSLEGRKGGRRGERKEKEQELRSIC